MEITYLGGLGFKLKSKSGFVICMDLIESDLADVVTVSQRDEEDGKVVKVVTTPVNRQETFVIDREGEYEIAGVQFTAMKTSPEKNLVMAIVMDGLHIVHLGSLGVELTDAQIEKLGSVDIMMIPMCEKNTFGVDETIDLIKEVQPSYVIPMLLTGLDEFLEKNKYPLVGEAVHKVKIDEGSLPDDTQILLMNG